MIFNRDGEWILVAQDVREGRCGEGETVNQRRLFHPRVLEQSLRKVGVYPAPGVHRFIQLMMVVIGWSREEGKYFEWFKSWEDVKQYVAPYVQRQDNILHVGCGNSALTEEMWADGYLRQVNIDYSETVILQMSHRCSHLPSTIECRQSPAKWYLAKCLSWFPGKTMDATNMNFDDATFDCVIDKGTMDALLVGSPLHRNQVSCLICHRLYKKILGLWTNHSALNWITTVRKYHGKLVVYAVCVFTHELPVCWK